VRAGDAGVIPRFSWWPVSSDTSPRTSCCKNTSEVSRKVYVSPPNECKCLRLMNTHLLQTQKLQEVGVDSCLGKCG